MTEVASEWEPERLSELIRIRIEVLTAVHEGRFDEAAEYAEHALPDIMESVSGVPDTPESVLPLTQVAGLLGDIALIEIGRGDTESASLYLTWMGDVEGRLSALTESLMLVGMERCAHGRRTLKPNGKCQFRPPCPP
jgi:hypothetical protein